MDGTKRCCTCHEVRPLSDFNVRTAARDGRQSRCRQCSRQWYLENRAAHRANVRRRQAVVKREYKRRIGEHLLANPCVDCGETDLRVLDFDHLDASTKRTEVAKLVNAAGRWSDIELEIAKCDVRCANCHRRVTADRARDWRALRAAEVRGTAVAQAARRLAEVLPAPDGRRSV